MIIYDLKMQVGKYAVELSTSEKYGWFEHDVYGDEAGGSLEFNDELELEDFDGMGVLPTEVCEAINKLGWSCDVDQFCE